MQGIVGTIESAEELTAVITTNHVIELNETPGLQYKVYCKECGC